MGTVKRYPFSVARRPGVSGEVWSASLTDARPAVVVCGAGGTREPDPTATVAGRLARAGLAAVRLACSWENAEPAARQTDVEAVCADLQEGKLVAGLRPPAWLVIFDYGHDAGVAQAHAARHEAVAVVTWRRVAKSSGAEDTVAVEMRAVGSHVIERSLQLGEALDLLLAWLARDIM